MDRCRSGPPGEFVVVVAIFFCISFFISYENKCVKNDISPQIEIPAFVIYICKQLAKCNKHVYD